MIRTVDIELNAANPNLPIAAIQAFVGSPISVRIRNVPRSVGNWKLTKVFLSANLPDNASRSVECKLVGGIWVGTLTGSAAVGVSVNGFTVTANGKDENDADVTGYVLGKGDVIILSADGTITVGETTYYVHLVATTPANPKKGDLDLSTMKLWNGSAWVSLGGGGGGGGDMSHSEFAALPAADLDPEETGISELCDLVNQMKNKLRPAALILAIAAALSASAASVTTNKLVNLKGASNVVTSVSFDGLAASADLDAKADLSGATFTGKITVPETSDLEIATMGRPLVPWIADNYVSISELTSIYAAIAEKADLSDINDAIDENEKEGTNEQIVRGKPIDDYWNIRAAFAWDAHNADSASSDGAGNNFLAEYYRASQIDESFVSKSTADSTSVFATNLLAAARADSGSIATNVVSPVYETVSAWENYWTGENVRISVTNYYGNTSGEPPRLRIEELDHKVTNTVAGVDYVTNVYKVVWDEVTRQTNYYARYAADVATISNNTLIAAERQTYNQLADKAPRAWGTVTSSGEKAPPNTVWHTAPRTVFAGGTEYAHVAIGDGEVCFLVDKGADVYTDGDVGQFYFKDASGQNFFGFDVRSAYTIGCRTDGIRVTNTNLVWLTYDLTTSVTPEILYATNLTDNVWQTADVTWEQNPPTGQMVAYLNNQGRRTGFYKAQINYAGGSKFITNMQADLAGGIAATNETSNVIQSVEPYIQNGNVYWRVKQ